jgi:predicted SAM-dependent methyltransferase
VGFKVIVGAGGAKQEGWISLEHDQLDIRSRDSWLQWFQPGTLDAVLSEHVLEHLQPDEAQQAASNIYEMLRPGGYWRVAVPDANNPDPKYQDNSRPHGPGQARLSFLRKLSLPSDQDYPDHKVNYDVRSLTQLLQGVGFSVQPLEWFDCCGCFRRNHWRSSDGYIKRSTEGSLAYLWFIYFCCDFWSVSLLVDGVKW